MSDNTKPVAVPTADERLESIRSLLAQPYPVVAASDSAVSTLLWAARELLTRLDGQNVPGFPGKPGSRWRDNDGTVWVLCDDGNMRACRHRTSPEDVKRHFGPLKPFGGDPR